MQKYKKFDCKYKLLFFCQINVIKTHKNEINGENRYEIVKKRK